MNQRWNHLHYSGRYGHLHLCKRLIDKRKFDVHMAKNCGCAALPKSVESGSYELNSFFADMGVDVYFKTINGWSCPNIAAVNGHLYLCEELIDKHDFDVDLKDNDG